MGHTHELVDALIAHIKSFMSGDGCGGNKQGAAVATPGGKTTMCNPEEPEKHGQFLTAQTKVNGDFKYNEVRIPVVNFQSD